MVQHSWNADALSRGAFNVESAFTGSRAAAASSSTGGAAAVSGNRLRSATSVLLSREMGFGMGPSGSGVSVGGSVGSGVSMSYASDILVAEDLHGVGRSSDGEGREHRDSSSSSSSFSFKLHSKHALRWVSLQSVVFFI